MIFLIVKLLQQKESHKSLFLSVLKEFSIYMLKLNFYLQILFFWFVCDFVFSGNFSHKKIYIHVRCSNVQRKTKAMRSKKNNSQQQPRKMCFYRCVDASEIALLSTFFLLLLYYFTWFTVLFSFLMFIKFLFLHSKFCITIMQFLT